MAKKQKAKVVQQNKSNTSTGTNEKSSLSIEDQIDSLVRRFDNFVAFIICDAAGIGELLEKKQQMYRRMNFKNWIREKLPLDPDDADTFIRIYRNKQNLKSRRIDFIRFFRDYLKYRNLGENKKREKVIDDPLGFESFTEFIHHILDNKEKEWFVVDDTEGYIHHVQNSEPLSNNDTSNDLLPDENRIINMTFDATLIGKDENGRTYYQVKTNEQGDPDFQLPESQAEYQWQCEAEAQEHMYESQPECKPNSEKSLKELLIEVMFCDYPLSLEDIVDRLYRLKGHSHEERWEGLITGLMISSPDFEGKTEFTCKRSPSGNHITQNTPI